MSGARKKSSFQITSITSEFEPPVAPPALELPEDTAAPRNGPPGAASRFRLVKLDQGPGEPFKRGRWTCLEFYDHDPEHQAVGRLLGAPRHPQSLDSRLELAGLLPKPHGYFSPPPPPQDAREQSSQPCGRHGAEPGGRRAAAAPQPRPAHPEGDGGEAQGKWARTPGFRRGRELHRVTPLAGVGGDHKGDGEWLGREGMTVVPPRGSRPSSPAPPFFREGSPVRRGSDPFGGLARSMFAMGGHQDSDDER
uniref:TSC22 domain family member 4 n=1 Tax=Terrapene triunguis TaxID=2587831 RepID=A0A674K1Z8_9SAUR